MGRRVTESLGSFFWVTGFIGMVVGERSRARGEREDGCGDRDGCGEREGCGESIGVFNVLVGRVPGFHNENPNKLSKTEYEGFFKRTIGK